ncbi:hypothetical protein AVEN_73504-1 [Araneus ventricosus]|uniref:Uncharacterized protein n=1 Tax=Araneus ventricosus TaxID=182803 RepID=A0A4Y2WPF1_ARAVE|nr:hypothetical protein AVEN_73504-1 [Araneus ventricosus]
MLSDGVILLHDNTHTARKTQELLRRFKWEVWSHPPTSQIRHSIWVLNTYLEQGSLQRVMRKQLPRTGSMDRTFKTIVTNMGNRFPAMLVLLLGKEFYRGKYGMTGSSQDWSPDLGDKSMIPENASLFSIFLLGKKIRLNIRENSM